MHLSYAESKLFYQMLHLIQDYVINVEGIHGDDEDDEYWENENEGANKSESENAFDEDRDLYRDHMDGLKALQYAARYPDVFDSLLTIFADRLNSKQIDLLRLWKHGLCEAPCTIMSYTENGNALFETDFGIVEVCGITQEIEELVPAVPCFAETVLMPFGEHIVYGGVISTYAVSFGPGITKRLQETLQSIKAGETEVIHSPENYIEKITAYKAKKKEDDFEKLFRDLERASDKANDKEPKVPGIHRGKLADIAEEDREGTIREYFASESPVTDEMVFALACNRAISHAPRRKLKTALGDLDRAELEDAAYFSGCAEFASSKSGLIEQIANAFEDKMTLRRFVSYSHEMDYEFFLEIAQANGRLVIAEDDLESLKKAWPFPPFTFLYHDTKEKRFVGFVDKGLLDQIATDDVIMMVQMRRLVEKTVHYAELAVGLYGLITVQDLSEMLLKEIGWEEENGLIDAILETVSDFQSVDYFIESLDDTPYLVHPFLAFEAIDLSEDLTDDEKKRGVDNLARYWKVVLDSHKRMERKPIDEFLDEETVYHWVLGLDSAIRLRTWLDAHIPEGEPDYEFADSLIEDIYLTTWGPADPHAVPNLILDAYEKLFESEEGSALINELLALAMRFVNDIPRWENNGYSPNEAVEKMEGRKLFYNEDGTIKKVGRNDPCPCGSGKKYKHCCGR